MEDTKQIYSKSSFVHRDFGPLVMWKWPAVRDWKAKRPGAGFCSRNLGDDDMGCKMPPQNSHAVLLAYIAQRHHLISMDFHIHCCLHRSVHCCLPAASGETFDKKNTRSTCFLCPLPETTRVHYNKRYHGKIYEIIHRPNYCFWPFLQSSSGTSNSIPEGTGGFVLCHFFFSTIKPTKMLHVWYIWLHFTKILWLSCR